MLALIDGDIIVYRVGYTTENEESFVAISRTNEMIENILLETGATEYKNFLSDSAGNFRRQLFPEYKANRTQPKPKHYQLIKDYLIEHWNAEITIGQEADDALGIEQYKCFNKGIESIICSIDKDLLQIPGYHYNFVKKERKEIDEAEGIKFFYQQLLTGDAVDNIKGCPGIGAVKSQKLLSLINDEESYYKVVMTAYKTAFNKLFEISEEEIEELIITTGQLLWIRRVEGEMWLPPKMTESLTLKSQSEQGLVLLLE